MSKYQHIHDELLKEITDGKYPDNTAIPSDFALMNRYKVARETSRKAVSMLVDEGYVIRIRGRGTYVINQNRFSFPISHVESYRELAARLKLDERTKLISISDENVPLVFDYRSDIDVHSSKVVRLRYLDNEPVIIDRDYVLKSIIPELTALTPSLSLFDLFEKEQGMTISYAKKTITIENANAVDRQLMSLTEPMAIVVIRSETFLNDGRIISFTESRHRGDRFKSVEFARRQ